MTASGPHLATGALIAQSRAEYPLAHLSISELVSGYQKAEFTPVDVLEQVLQIAQTAGRTVNAITVLDERARGLAEQSTQRWAAEAPIGQLDGVPITVKDSLAVVGLPSTRASVLLADAPPENEAEPAVARLVEAGAIVVAKTTMPEYAWAAVSDSQLHGIVRNAWDSSKTAGGSSGGAAAAVALGIGAIALGSDGGGSIRIPAALNGVVGVKATYGRIAATSSGPFGRLAHIGPLTRTVTDAAIALDITSAGDARDADWLGPADVNYESVVSGATLTEGRLPAQIRHLRIATSLDLGYNEVSASVAQVFGATLERLAAAGADISPAELQLPNHATVIADVWAGVIAAGLSHLSEPDLDQLHPGLSATIRRGKTLDAVTHLNNHARIAESIGLPLAELFHSSDVLLTPTLPLTAFAAGRLHPQHEQGGEWFGWNGFAWQFNITGHPAISVPIGFDAAGLPIGIQVVARRGRDQDALLIAKAIESLNT